MKNFQVSLLKKTHSHKNVVGKMHGSRALCFLQLPYFSFEQKYSLQKELLTNGFLLCKIDDKVTSSYGTVELNSSNLFCIHFPSSSGLKEEFLFQSLLKTLSIIRQKYKSSIVLGLKYGEQFGTFSTYQRLEEASAQEYNNIIHAPLFNLLQPTHQLIEHTQPVKSLLYVLDRNP